VKRRFFFFFFFFGREASVTSVSSSESRVSSGITEKDRIYLKTYLKNEILDGDGKEDHEQK